MWRVLCHNQNCGREIVQKETRTNQNDGIGTVALLGAIVL
jgi:hypothetical protein